MARETVNGKPIPTKFDPAEEQLIRDINEETKLPLGQIIKRAARFALPKFASGEISLLTLEPVPAGSRTPLVGAPNETNGKANA
jgi:hypothetical protein